MAVCDVVVLLRSNLEAQTYLDILLNDVVMKWFH